MQFIRGLIYFREKIIKLSVGFLCNNLIPGISNNLVSYVIRSVSCFRQKLSDSVLPKISGRSYKHFKLVNYDSKVVIWGIFQSVTTLEPKMFIRLATAKSMITYARQIGL